MAFPSILGCHRCSQTELFNSVRQCCFRPHLRGWSTYTVTVCSLVSPHCMNSGAILLLLYCCYHFMKSTFQAKKKKLSKKTVIYFATDVTFCCPSHQKKNIANVSVQKQSPVALFALWRVWNDPAELLFLLHCCSLVVDPDMRGGLVLTKCESQ